MDTRKLSDRIKKREAADAAKLVGPLHPPISLLCKLGSIAVHADELLSPSGHSFDKDALQALLRDAEVRHWIAEMGPFMPVKR